MSGFESMFVGTILGPAFARSLPRSMPWRTSATGRWVLSKYNDESARRKAHPLARSTAPRVGAFLAAVGQPRICKEAAERGHSDPRPEMSKVEYYECHKKGHYARDCRSKAKTGGNQPRSDQVNKNHRRGHRDTERGNCWNGT
jgi:hypothetical protein